MGYRPHINTKRVIEYKEASAGFSWSYDELAEWFNDNGVDIPQYEGGLQDWELSKESLRRIGEDAYRNTEERYGGLKPEDLRILVRDLLASEANPDYAYLSWW